MARWIVILSACSLVGMILIDRALGPRAEFLNAWSVVERRVGRTPSAGDSQVAQRLGALGEVVVVIVANVAIGAALAGLARLARRLVG